MQARFAVMVMALAMALPAAAGLVAVDHGAQDGAGAAGEVRFDPRVVARIASAPLLLQDVLVTVAGKATHDDLAAFEALGLEVLRGYPDFGVLYVRGTGADLARLGETGRAVLVSADDPGDLRYHMNTATIATRAREAWDAKSTSTTPVRDAQGDVVDGRGVGIAIIDTGVDATHPDLGPSMGENRKFLCATPFIKNGATGTCMTNNLANDPLACSNTFWPEVPSSDTSSGHGTHVAGIAAGRGGGSDGRFTGAAPGASIWGMGIGEVLFPIYTVEALNWVHCHHATTSPPIRIVSNSWGGTGDFDPDDPINRAVDTLVQQDGIVVVFSAGNDGGDGNVDNVNRYAKNPLPGVVNVANYDDDGIATRTGVLADSSSCGLETDTDPTHWPDVTAPGTFITSALAKGTPLGTFEFAYMPYYVTISGTSMAAPHVSGVVAMMLQAQPGLSPAQVEDLLEDHALAFATDGAYVSDSTNPTSLVNYCAGHGLIDAIATLEDARVLGGSGRGSPQPQVHAQPSIDAPFTTEDFQWPSGVRWTVVSGQTSTVTIQDLASGDASAWPVASGQAARLRIDCPWGLTTLAGTLGSVPGGGLGFTVSHAFTLPTGFANPSPCDVEAHLDFGGSRGMVAVDSFVVRVLDAGF